MPKQLTGALIGGGFAFAWLRFGFLGMLFIALMAAAGWAIEQYVWPRRAALMAFFQNGAQNRRREVR